MEIISTQLSQVLIGNSTPQEGMPLGEAGLFEALLAALTSTVSESLGITSTGDAIEETSEEVVVAFAESEEDELPEFALTSQILAPSIHIVEPDRFISPDNQSVSISASKQISPVVQQVESGVVQLPESKNTVFREVKGVSEIPINDQMQGFNLNSDGMQVEIPAKVYTTSKVDAQPVDLFVHKSMNEGSVYKAQTLIRQAQTKPEQDIPYVSLTHNVQVQTPETGHVEITELEPREITSEVLTQVTEGIQLKLSSPESADSKFVIKLKPEGLGEITVEMDQEGGKVLLNIASSDSRTGKLLAEELHALGGALKEFNAEVRQLILPSEQPQPRSDLTFSSGRSFAEERRQTHEYRPTYDYPDESPPDITSAGQYQESSLLSRYI